MLIDCDTCVVRGLACADCVVSVLLGGSPTGIDLDDTERTALAVLADAGMVPRLRLVPQTHSCAASSRSASRKVAQGGERKAV